MNLERDSPEPCRRVAIAIDANRRVAPIRDDQNRYVRIQELTRAAVKLQRELTRLLSLTR